MNKLHIAWMYPNLLNLHGERGSVQALEEIGKNLGIDITITRVEDFDDPIDFTQYDLLVFLPGEISSFRHLIPALKNDAFYSYVENGGHILAIGTSGLLFGKSITREDGSVMECLGCLDMTAKERQYVWGDDLHLRLMDNKQEIVGSQIQMADVEAANPLAAVLYGRGNNKTGVDGARYKNVLYTNCLGPLFVKNPWFAEEILKNILLQKIGIIRKSPNTIASDSFDSTLRFIKTKQ